jgi:DNA-sulfur modification-associated
MSGLSIPVRAIAAPGNPNYQQFAVFLTPDVLRQALGHDPRDHKRKQLRSERPELADIYESVQRKMTKKRRDGLAPYIINRMLVQVTGPGLGVLPAMMVGFTNNPVFLSDDERNSDGTGTLHLSLSEDEVRVVLDGLGRTDTILALREGYNVDGTVLRMTDSSKLPLLVHIIAPHPGKSWSFEHLQQCFHDINCLAEPVRPAIAIRGEHADVFIQLTRELGECDAISVYGGMTVGSPNPKGGDLLSQQQLLKFVRAAIGGPRAAESDSFRVPQQERIQRELGAYSSALCEYLGAAAEAMGEEGWQDRQGSFHLTSAGWTTMGLAYWYTGSLNDKLRETGKRPLDPVEVAEVIMKKIDWSRGNPEWAKLGVAKQNKDGEWVIAGAGRSTRAAMFASVAHTLLAKWPYTAEAARELLPSMFAEATEPVTV